jgi:hypothetical protein
LALHHAGFAVPPMLPSGRWALTPPFHPYQALSPSAIRLRGLLSGCLKVFLQMATEARCTGGLFSVALSVAGNLASLARIARRVGPLALPGALPFSLRRHTPEIFIPSVRREDHGVRTFLPACLLAKAGPAITRLARRAQYIILCSAPACAWDGKLTTRLANRTD